MDASIEELNKRKMIMIKIMKKKKIKKPYYWVIKKEEKYKSKVGLGIFSLMSFFIFYD